MIIKIIVVVFILFIAGVISLLQNMAMVDSIVGTAQNQTNGDKNPVKNLGNDVVEFEGTLTDFDAGCAVDAFCYAIVDSKYKIQTAGGDMLIPEGQRTQYGMSNVWDEHIGQKVKVRAKKISGTQYILVNDESEPMLYVLRIGEHFACSDNCPGNPAKYTKIIFEEISDPEVCKQIGGTPYEYVGWGVYKICIAE